MVLKETMENYVKAIYSLSRWGEVRPYQLADYLSVSRPTVSTTVRSLVEEGFVCVDDRKEIHLTRKGLKIAKEMMEKHNVLFNLLVSLGVAIVDVAQLGCTTLAAAVSPITDGATL